jgi:hypothetical protein
MIVRNLDYLSIPKELKKVELEIYKDRFIDLIKIEEIGYALHTNKGDNRSNLFLLKTPLSPSDFNIEENIEEKDDFINIILILLNELYEDLNIKEYEKQHQEFIFLHLMDMLEDDSEVEILTKESELYRFIEDGVIKLDIDISKDQYATLETAIETLSAETGTNFSLDDMESKFKSFIKK